MVEWIYESGKVFVLNLIRRYEDCRILTKRIRGVSSMKKLHIYSDKSACISALVQAFLSVLLCILFTYIVLRLTGFEEFIGKDGKEEIINGIRYDVVLCIGAVVSAFVPILLLRYNEIKYLFLFLLSSVMFYVIILFLVVLFLIGGSFDFINYATTSFPVGAGMGTVIAIIINTIENRKE